MYIQSYEAYVAKYEQTQAVNTTCNMSHQLYDIPSRVLF